MDSTGDARITDFGLRAVCKFQDPVSSVSLRYAVRFTAPEILNGQGTYSKEADVFSFAMVMIEVRYGWVLPVETCAHRHSVWSQVFTGMIPFNNSLPAAAMLAIITGKRPLRPIHHQLTDQLWTLIQHCWDQNPYSRPGVPEGFKTLCGP